MPKDLKRKTPNQAPVPVPVPTQDQAPPKPIYQVSPKMLFFQQNSGTYNQLQANGNYEASNIELFRLDYDWFSRVYGNVVLHGRLIEEANELNVSYDF